MSPGSIMLLNGTSSARKTSIVNAFQDLMDEPWLHTGIDEHAPSLAAKFTTVTYLPDPVLSEYTTLIYRASVERVTQTVAGRGEVSFGSGYLVDVHAGPKGLQLRAALFHGIASMAAVGVNLVVDEVFVDPRVLDAAVTALVKTDVLFVGLYLPLAVAEQRERERGDRGPGGTRLFYDRVHAHGSYDLELDTSHHTPHECAKLIQQALAADLLPRAIRHLYRSRRGNTESVEEAMVRE